MSPGTIARTRRSATRRLISGIGIELGIFSAMVTRPLLPRARDPGKTDRKFDPTDLARPANCGGCAPIQGLHLRAGAFCASGRSIRRVGGARRTSTAALTLRAALRDIGHVMVGEMKDRVCQLVGSLRRRAVLGRFGSPAAQVIEDAADDLRIVNQRDDTHRRLDSVAAARVSAPRTAACFAHSPRTRLESQR